MGLDALGIWILISVTSPGEIIAFSETEDGCITTRSVYLQALDPDFPKPGDSWAPYGRAINPEISKLAKCVFIPYEDLTPPEDL